MARGSESKVTVTNKILEVFPNAFVYGKEIRIPLVENGEEVQIKVALTCAKENVAGGSSNAASELVSPQINPADTKITPEEKQEVKDIIAKLNL